MRRPPLPVALLLLLARAEVVFPLLQAVLVVAAVGGGIIGIEIGMRHCCRIMGSIIQRRPPRGSHIMQKEAAQEAAQH